MKRLTGRRMYRVGLAAAALALVVLAARFAPTAALSLSLALPATEASLALFFPDAVREEIVLSAGSRAIQADLYRPVTPRAALLLVHGLSRAGRRHAELVRLARLLARHGQLVLVPQFEGLVAFRLDGTEIDEIRGALGYLGGLSPAVGIAGFSFGAGPALLAAAAYPEIALVGSFGGYADLQNVIAYVTTGVHTFGGRRYVQQQEEYNRWKLLALLVGFVESERDRTLLGAIARRTLENPGVDTTALAAPLGRDGQAVLSLILNRQASAVMGLVADLSPRTRQALASLSPLAAVPRLRGRLLIAHGVADDSIPFTESLRLAEAAGGRAELTLLDTFHHTGAQPFWWSWRARVADGWNLARLADALVRIDRHRRSARSGVSSEPTQTEVLRVTLAAGMSVARRDSTEAPPTTTRQLSMHDAGSMPHPSEPPVRYLFIVARNRPDMLEQVKERLRGDTRIEVIADRRYGERRRSAVPREPDRRGADRRRPTKARDDLSVYPTLVVQKHVESYAELQQKVVASARESQDLREENDRLRAELSSLNDRLEALLSADAAFKADAIAHLTQAEDTVLSLVARFRALTSQ